MKNYRKVNIELTDKLVGKLMDEKLNTDRWEHKLKNNYEKVTKIISMFADKNKPLLEIGVRVGYLFDYLKEAGFTNDMKVDCQKNYELEGILYYQCGIIHGPYKKTKVKRRVPQIHKS